MEQRSETKQEPKVAGNGSGRKKKETKVEEAEKAERSINKESGTRRT